MASTSTSKTFPGFSHIYELDDDDAFARHYRVDIELGDTIDWALLRGEVDIPGLTTKWAMGRKTPGAVFWTTRVGLAFLRDDIVAMLTDNGFTGWRVSPFHLSDAAADVASRYSFLSITGRCGAIQYEKSETRMTRYPAGLFPCRHGVYFDPATWDGSDFFMPRSGYNGVFVTERVKNAFAAKRVRNVGFRALDAIEIPMEIPWGEGGSQGA